MKTAILITCYNRVETTKKCLKKCFNSLSLIKNCDHDIYLLDDNSPDKTGEIIKKEYPNIYVIYGDGKLFWTGGTRKLWNLASTKKKYDYYVWLNDDSFLFKNAFKIMYNDIIFKKPSILVGTFVSSKQAAKEITYGGRNNNFELLIPSGKPQECTLINGNFVFISKEVFEKISVLNNVFTHNYGDIDYGLRAIKAGFKIFIASYIVGTCDKNKIEVWRSPNTTIFQRLNSFNKTKNFIISEVKYFQLTHYGFFGFFKNFLGVFLIILSPKIYYKLTKFNHK